MSHAYGSGSKKAPSKAEIAQAKQALSLLKAQKERGETAAQRIASQTATSEAVYKKPLATKQPPGPAKGKSSDGQAPEANYRKVFVPGNASSEEDKLGSRAQSSSNSKSKSKSKPTGKAAKVPTAVLDPGEEDGNVEPVVPSRHFDQPFEARKPVAGPGKKPPPSTSGKAPPPTDDLPIKLGKGAPSMGEEEENRGPMEKCQYCERKFNPESLAKHENVCQERPDKPKRKAFNSQKARVVTSEQEKLLTEAKKEDKRAKAAPPKKKIPKWKMQSEQFRAVMKNSQQNEDGTSAPVQLDPQYDEKSDYIQCPTCGRSFNVDAGKRHIPFCAKKQMLDKLKNPQKYKGASNPGKKK
jgi:hypothetical protein